MACQFAHNTVLDYCFYCLSGGSDLWSYLHTKQCLMHCLLLQLIVKREWIAHRAVPDAVLLVASFDCRKGVAVVNT